MLSNSDVLESIKSAFFLTGAALALFVWILDPVIDAVFLGEGTIYNQIFHPSPSEIYMRTVTSLLIISLCFIGSVLLTRSRQAKEALAKREEELHAIIDTSRDWIWAIDLQGVHTYSNTAIEKILGYHVDDLLGKPSLEFMHDEDWKYVEFNLLEWINERRGWNNLILRWQHKDGTYRYLESNAVPVFDLQGEVTGFRGVDRDVTERQQTDATIDAIHTATAKVMGEEFFLELVSSMGELFKVEYAFIGKLVSQDEIATVAFWDHGNFVKNFQYSLVDTPCMNVIQRSTCFYPSNVQNQFPNDQLLAEMNVESYMGTPLRDTEGCTLGLLVVMGQKPMSNIPMLQSIVEIFAARAATELRRRETETLNQGQQRILEMVSQDTNTLTTIFEAIIAFTEEQCPGVRASVLCVHDNKLQHGAAPSMPDAYNELINGFHIGPNAASCGTAAYRGERVVVADVLSDPLWTDYRHLGEDYGFRACWSEPIFDSGGKVWATFALYHEKPGIPSDFEIRLIDAMAKLVSIGIEHKRKEDELQKLSRAVEFSSTAVIITDCDLNIEYINPKFTENTGYNRGDVVGKNLFFLRSEETTDGGHAKILETITSGGEWKGELNNRKADGSLYWCRTSISSVKNSNGDITNFISIQEDVTHEFELSEQLSYQASHDALTGLINRHEFERRAERLLSTIRQDKTEHALCFMDLDQFKVVNDTCGHTAGDELLRQLGSILINTVRHRDTLARLGGDEFGVLMEHCSLDDAHRVATSLQKAIQDYQFSWEGHIFRVGVSIGLVVITETIADITELLRDADVACYMAKDKGRNRIHVHHPEDSEVAQRHGEMQWVTRLNQALEDDRLCLYAQSIVPLDGSAYNHYELLIRMIDERGEIILPDSFLPAAERYNLISKIDHWVIETFFGLLLDNPAFQKQIQFCTINLSGQSLTDPGILDFIINQHDESGIKGETICFEITETAAILNLNTASRFISILKDLGFRFSLDDFGSGLSSFGYLKNLPVDYLKIDGMFVKNIVDDPIDHAMVKSINEIGHVMGMQTIAEFVENDEIKGMLREIGVNYAQGYGVGKPLPFDDLLSRTSNITEIKRSK